MQRIANRSYIDQRPGQECPDVVKVDRESAFDFAVDHAGDNVIFLMRSFNSIQIRRVSPSLAIGGFHRSRLPRLERDFDFITDC